MSTTVDERVLSMQFDNKHFESNVATSMSTLDKLKQKLNLSGASKGMDNVGSAAETVQAKFSALQVIGVTALSNITNSAVNAGKRIVSALTIDPIKTGFSEYELKMDSVKTIMASTGENVKTVNKYLKELNDYSDQTIYSFSDMTQNIGKFTNAGVKLEDAVMAIKGISNEAAVSGANANEASRAMYNFAQALSAGHVKLIDWKSIENANMATVEFKEQLIASAVACGTLTETSDGMYKTLAGKTLSATQNFNDTLQDQWMTTDVLVKTLKDYADENTEIGKKAKAAAQEVTKLSQVFDIAKETAQSGWAETWEILFGDINQAKALFTPISDFINGIIAKYDDFRNTILRSALGRGFSDLATKIRSVLDPIKNTADSIKGITDTVKDYDKVVNEIIAGKWGNAPTRWQDLTEAGYDWAHAQNLVNERLGDATRHATNYSEAQNGVSKSQDKAADSTKQLTKEEIKCFSELVKMTDEQLKAKGYTDDQIKAIRALEEELRKLADKLGLPFDVFLEKINEIDGRWLLIESFKNIGKGLISIFKEIGNAWKEVFKPKSTEEKANALFDIIAAFHRMTAKFRDFFKEEKNAKNLRDTFKGLFSILKLVTNILGGGFKLAFKIVSTLLGMFNINILDVTGAVGRAITRFTEWTEKLIDLEVVLRPVKDIIDIIRKAFSKVDFSAAITGIKEWIASLKDSENLPKDIADGIINGLGKAFGFIGSIFGEIGAYLADKFGLVPGDIISGFTNGMRDGIPIALETIWELGKRLISKIKEVLGIHSPSTVFFAIGAFIISGLLLGLTDNLQPVLDFFSNMGTKIGDVLSKVDWGKLFGAGMSAGMLVVAFKMADTLSNLTSAFDGFGDFLQQLGNATKRVSRGIANNLNSKALLNIALAIGILVAAVIALTFVDWKKALVAVGIIAALMIGLGVFMAALSKFNSTSAAGVKSVLSFAGMVLSLGIALLLISFAIRNLAAVNPDKALSVIGMFTAIMVELMALMLVSSFAGGGTAKAGKGLLGIAVAIGILVLVMKMIAKMEYEDIVKGILVVGALGVLIAFLVASTFLAGKNIKGVASAMMGIAIAIGILVLVMKMIAKMEYEDLFKGILTVAALSVIIVGLIAATKLVGKNIAGIAGCMFGLAAVIGVLGLVVGMLGGMKTSTLIKGVLAVAALAAIIVGLIAATKLAGNPTKLAGTLLALSIAIGILAAVVYALSFLKEEDLVKSLAAITVLGGVMTAMIVATKGAAQCHKNILMMTIAIGVMAAAIALLSFIDPARLAVATGALAGVMGMFALMIAMTKFIKTGEKGWKRSLVTIGVMTLVTAALAGVIFLLSKCNAKSVLSNTAALSMLLLTLSGALLIISKSKSMSKQQLPRILASLGVMTLVVAALAGVLWAMSVLKVKNSISNTIALSILLVAMSASLVILSKIGRSAKNALLGVVGLLAMAVPLLAFVGVLALMQGVQNATANATILASLATVLTLLLIPLSLIGALIGATGGTALLGVVGLLAMAVPLVALVGVLALMQGVKNAEANANLLIKLLTTMTVILVVLAIIGPLAMVGVAAMTAFTALIVAIGAIAVAVGALMEKFPALQSFLDTGLPILEQLAGSLGTMIGKFVDGFLTAATENLPQIGLSLSEFMTNVTPFIDGAKNIDDSVLTGILNLSGAIIALTAADLIAGIVSFLQGGSSFAKLGTELSTFMINAKPFITGASMLNASMMEGVKALAETILILTAADIISGLTSWLTGGSSLESFGAQLGGLGTNLAEFSTNLGTFGPDQATTISCAADAIKSLAEASKSLPNEGGWISKIVGDSNIETFGGYLPGLGSNLASFVANLGTFTDEQVATVTCAANAIKSMAEAAEAIPNEGGWVSKIVGDNSIETFGGYLPGLGTNLAGFAANLGTFAEDKVATVTCAADAIKSLAEAASVIPNEGGWVSKIVGDNSIETFGGYLPGLGTNLASFATNLGTFDTDKVATVECGANAIKAMAEAAKSLPNEGGWWSKIVGDSSIETFGGYLPGLGEDLAGFAEKLGTFGDDEIVSISNAIKVIEALSGLAEVGIKSLKDHIAGLGDKLVAFGEDLATFAADMAEVSSTDLSKAVNRVTDIKDLLTSLSEIDPDVASDFKSAIKDLANTGVTAFINKFKDSDSLTDAKDAAKKLASNAVDGIESKLDAFKDACKKFPKDGASAIETKSNKTSFKDAGKYLGAGLVEGIKAKYDAVYDAAYELGQKAVQGEKDGQKSKSPSRLTILAGHWLGEGLIIGMNEMGKKVYRAGSNLGSTATNTISSAISRIADAVNSDIDAQPTIRPVLDLSDVKAGAGMIDGMFGITPSVGLLTNVGAINTMMNRNRQNGANDDVVSAIKDLRDGISGMGNSYNINGVTYNEGSDVADALETIIRAAIVERRV